MAATRALKLNCCTEAVWTVALSRLFHSAAVLIKEWVPQLVCAAVWNYIELSYHCFLCCHHCNGIGYKCMWRSQVIVRLESVYHWHCTSLCGLKVIKQYDIKKRKSSGAVWKWNWKWRWISWAPSVPYNNNILIILLKVSVDAKQHLKKMINH